MTGKNFLHRNDSAHLEKLRRLLPELMRFAGAMRGFLIEKEMKFLALAAACPTAEGVILEIGTFMGKSTTILASAGRLAPATEVVAVDPLKLRSIPGNRESWLAELKANLRSVQVEQLVEFHNIPSQELAPLWKRERKIRFLWIDARHDYAGVKEDFDNFSPFLADGAIVALHDCFRREIGPMRVFAEDILSSKKFGATGACGSIGWAQFRANPEENEPFTEAKLKLYQRTQRLISHAERNPPRGLKNVWYKLLRSRISHGEVDPVNWLGQVTSAI